MVLLPINTMETNGYQKELFELEKPKRSFPRLASILSRKDAAITLTMERAVFAAIGLIMFAVLIYAAGVERGKAIGLKAGGASKVKNMTAPPAAIPTAPPAVQKSAETTPAQTRPPVRPYSIVAASFSKKQWALTEANLLKKRGYDAFVYESHPYFLVCVGSYATKESSQDTLKKIKRMYKDAYLKLR